MGIGEEALSGDNLRLARPAVDKPRTVAVRKDLKDLARGSQCLSSNLCVRLKVSICLSHKLLVAYTLNRRTHKFLESVASNEKIMMVFVLVVLARRQSPQCGACSPQLSFI